MNHRRRNRPDGHHYPWRVARPEECHCYGGGHQGAARGRAAHKRNLRQEERRQGKQLTEAELNMTVGQ